MVTTITDWNDLNDVRNNLSGDYELGNSLDANTAGYSTHVSSPSNGWESIAGTDPSTGDFETFTGTFDGQGYIISGLQTSASTRHIGLFGVVDTATLKNVTISSPSISANARLVGGLVGLTLDSLSGDLLIDNCAVTDGSISGTGNRFTGGLIGSSSASTSSTVKNSYATCSVSSSDELGVGGLIGASNSTIENCYATGNVSGFNYLGGLIGQGNGSTVKNSYATGDVKESASDYTGGLMGNIDGDTVSQCYSTGIVEGNNRVGGLIGWVTGSGATVSKSFADGDVSGSLYIGGLVGLQETGSVKNTYANNAVSSSEDTAGGLLSESRATVTTSYSVGDVTAAKTGTSGIDVGGLIGRNDGGSVTDCYWDDASSTVTEGGSEVTGQSDGGTPLTTSEMQDDAAKENMDGFDFTTVWLTSDTYPVFEWNPSTIGLEGSDFVFVEGRNVVTSTQSGNISF